MAPAPDGAPAAGPGPASCPEPSFCLRPPAGGNLRVDVDYGVDVFVDVDVDVDVNLIHIHIHINIHINPIVHIDALVASGWGPEAGARLGAGGRTWASGGSSVGGRSHPPPRGADSMWTWMLMWI